MEPNTVNKRMKLKALIYFEILFNSTDLLEKTLFKNKAVEVNTVKNFKRTKIYTGSFFKKYIKLNTVDKNIKLNAEFLF